MSLENLKYIGSTNAIGHGNPATLDALHQLAKDAGQEFTPIFINESAIAAQIFHTVMSKTNWVRERYTNNSESLRSSFVGLAFARMCFYELVLRLKTQLRNTNDTPLHWIAVQEHPVLGSWPKALDFLNIQEVTLNVPDVYPKKSAELAAQRLQQSWGGKVQFGTWNTPAYEHLQNLGFPVELQKPPLLDAYRPEGNGFMKEGRAIVAKSSGSGMPESWIKTLQGRFRQIDETSVLHLPTSSRKQDIRNFFDSLGGQTHLVISYPSEVVQVVAALRQREVPTHYVALPPRGQHEMENLVFAVKTNLVTALLDFEDGSDSKDPRLSSLPRIRPSELNDLLHDSAILSNPSEYLGTEPIFEKMR